MVQPRTSVAGVALALALVSVALVCWVSVEDSTMENFKAEEGLSRAVKGVLKGVMKFKANLSAKRKAASASPSSTLQNIIKLKAYSALARDKAMDMEDSGLKNAGIVPFLVAFGKKTQCKKKNMAKCQRETNVISLYAKLYARFSAKFRHGLPFYLMKKLNKHVIHGKGVVGLWRGTVGMSGYANWITLDHDKLGLSTKPFYFKKLAVRFSAYDAAVRKLTATYGDADSLAAAQLLQGKSKREYKSFYAREVAKAKRIQAKYFDHIVKAADTAEATAYATALSTNKHAKLAHAGIQAPAGLQAANYVGSKIQWKFPSYKKLRAKAKTAANAFMKKLKKKMKSTKAVVKAAQKKSLGVLLTVRTGDWMKSESQQQPKVTFIGTRGNLQGRLRAVPPQGQTFTQTFSTPHVLGKLKAIRLEAAGGDPWFVHSIEAHMESTGQHLKVPKKNFWLAGKPYDVSSRQVFGDAEFSDMFELNEDMPMKKSTPTN